MMQPVPFPLEGGRPGWGWETARVRPPQPSPIKGEGVIIDAVLTFFMLGNLRRSTVDFSHSDKVKQLQERLTRFMEANVYPAEPVFAAEVEENRRQGNAWV